MGSVSIICQHCGLKDAYCFNKDVCLRMPRNDRLPADDVTEDLRPVRSTPFLEAIHRGDVEPVTTDEEDERKPRLASDAKTRKDAPMARGLLDYFPNACAAVAELSRIGNEQHNPGQPMHWAREKSTDHADCIIRHMVDRGTIDTDGVRHSTKVVWRALALLQTELEEAGEA